MTVTAPHPATWSQGLDGPAYDIVMSEADRLRVAAGPGTGKSFAMMRRVAKLLSEGIDPEGIDPEGIDPERILMVTFTRTAARDILESLEKLGTAGWDDIKVGSLHSLCFGMLSRNEVLTMTGRIPRPMMKFEQRVIYEDLKMPGRGVDECEEFIKAFEAGWARLQSDEPGWPHQPEEQDFQRDMLDWLRFHEAMLMAEIIIGTRNYLRNNPGCIERQAFDHVIVDEYQDLNRTDQEVIDLLAEGGVLAVVGDEDQAIYAGMRYAQPESMQAFSGRHPRTVSMALEVCWRCPKIVIAMANSLIKHNSNREDHEPIPTDGRDDGTVEIVQWQSMEQEASGLATKIETFIRDREIALRDVLVLVPRRKIGYLIRGALRARSIVAHSYFYEEALDTQMDRERFTLLSLLVNPKDRVSLRYWLGARSTTYLVGSYAYLRRHCEVNSLDPFDVLDQAANGTAGLTRIGPLVIRYRLLLEQKATLDGLVDEALIDTLFPDVEELADIRRVALDALQLSEQQLGPKELFDEIRMRVIYPEPPPQADYVRIMSLHKSKGLSARLVVVAGCIQGAIPKVTEGMPGDEAKRQLEDQRRLFHVAITRAREVLVLSSFLSTTMPMALQLGIKFRSRSNGPVYTIASQFMEDIGGSGPPPKRG